jgi:hypothetical protein
MNLKRNKKILRNLSLGIGFSMILTLFPAGALSATLEKSASRGIHSDDFSKYLYFSAIINPNSIVGLDGICLISVDKDKKTDKTTKDRVKDHTNSTSRKPANGDD